MLKFLIIGIIASVLYTVYEGYTEHKKKEKTDCRIKNFNEETAGDSDADAG